MVNENQPSPIYVIAAHPNWRDSRVNRQLHTAATTTAGVSVCDLYETYPDYAIEVQAEQAKLDAAPDGTDKRPPATGGKGNDTDIDCL